MNLALFDFDGTITTGDTWTPFMRFAVRPARAVTGRLRLLPAFVGYKLGLVPASRIRLMAARVSFQGVDAASVRRLGAEYAEKVLPGTVRPDALERIEWHRSQGDRIVVVSGSLDVYIGPWCAQHRLEFICTTLEEHDGTLTGACVEGDCVGGEKPRRILQRYDLTQYELVYAYGNTAEDREMLDLAHRKYYCWKEL